MVNNQIKFLVLYFSCNCRFVKARRQLNLKRQKTLIILLMPNGIYSNVANNYSGQNYVTGIVSLKWESPYMKDRLLYWDRALISRAEALGYDAPLKLLNDDLNGAIILTIVRLILCPLRWRHNWRDGVSKHQARDVYSTVYWGADQRKHQSSASLAFVRGIHRWPVNSPHKGPVTRVMFPFHYIIMREYLHISPHFPRMGILTDLSLRPRSNITPFDNTDITLKPYLFAIN